MIFEVASERGRVEPAFFPFAAVSRKGRAKRERGLVSGYTTMASDPQDEKRTSSRRRVYKGAHISFGGMSASIDCVVRNYSETGARLAMQSTVGVPDAFELVRQGFPPRHCRVVWRHASELGVAFE